MTDFCKNLHSMPIIPVLRGISGDDRHWVADTLVHCGYTIMEATLNSPDAYDTLRFMADTYGDTMSVGVGTVTDYKQVPLVKDTGVDFIISPNMNTDVIKATKDAGLVSLPGCFTPSECFDAIQAGADVLKLFPGDMLGLSFVKSIKAVLPPEIPLCITGGVTVDTIRDFLSAGVQGVGIGSALYKSGKSQERFYADAQSFINAVS